MGIEPVSDLGHTVIAPYRCDAVSNCVADGHNCLHGLRREGKRFGTDDGLVEGQFDWGEFGETSAGGVGDGLGLVGMNFVGEADALHGEVEPLEGDEVEAGDVVECLMVSSHKLVELVLALKGEMPGVEPPVGVPSWPPPPVVAELRRMRGRHVVIVVQLVRLRQGRKAPPAPARCRSRRSRLRGRLARWTR